MSLGQAQRESQVEALTDGKVTCLLELVLQSDQLFISESCASSPRLGSSAIFIIIVVIITLLIIELLMVIATAMHAMVLVVLVVIVPVNAIVSQLGHARLAVVALLVVTAIQAVIVVELFVLDHSATTSLLLVWFFGVVHFGSVLTGWILVRVLSRFAQLFVRLHSLSSSWQSTWSVRTVGARACAAIFVHVLIKQLLHHHELARGLD